MGEVRRMIRIIKWDDHKVLGNLELDFTKADGTPYNTIVLAGENGTGKTQILETISTFLDLGSFDNFQYMKYEIIGENFTIHKEGVLNPQFGFHKRKNEETGVEVYISSNRNNSIESIEKDKNDIRGYGFAYSKAKSGFKTDRVTASTIQQLDKEKYENDNKENYTSIKQLLVDVDTQDNADWMRITKNKETVTFEEFRNRSRLNRFESAFNDFFDRIKFANIDNTDPSEKKILFEKNNKRFSVDELSTGEKQIVFRGAVLLKNVNGINSGVVLVDEPELSMHPKWQQRILQYYRNLFTVNGVQNVQMIFATHSEYVIKAALEDRDNVLIITLSDNNGCVVANKMLTPMVLQALTAGEINYLAFGILSVDYHIALYGYLQSKYGLDSIKACDTYIESKSPIYQRNIHEKIDNYVNSNGRTTLYKTLPTYIRNYIDHPEGNRQPYTERELEESIKLLIELCR